ncbi:1729_t:CDS:1, partial [Dentiscutata heterogama]
MSNSLLVNFGYLVEIIFWLTLYALVNYCIFLRAYLRGVYHLYFNVLSPLFSPFSIHVVEIVSTFWHTTLAHVKTVSKLAETVSVTEFYIVTERIQQISNSILIKFGYLAEIIFWLTLYTLVNYSMILRAYVRLVYHLFFYVLPSLLCFLFPTRVEIVSTFRQSYVETVSKLTKTVSGKDIVPPSLLFLFFYVLPPLFSLFSNVIPTLFSLFSYALPFPPLFSLFCYVLPSLFPLFSYIIPTLYFYVLQTLLSLISYALPTLLSFFSCVLLCSLSSYVLQILFSLFSY